MSTLFALVKTHNYLIYISFPPQNRIPLCASATRLPHPTHPPLLPPAPTIRVIIQSASELRVGKGKAPMSRTGTGGWTETDREKAHGRRDAQAGSASKGYFLGRKCSGGPPEAAVTELEAQYKHGLYFLTQVTAP